MRSVTGQKASDDGPEANRTVTVSKAAHESGYGGTGTVTGVQIDPIGRIGVFVRVRWSDAAKKGPKKGLRSTLKSYISDLHNGTTYPAGKLMKVELAEEDSGLDVLDEDGDDCPRVPAASADAADAGSGREGEDSNGNSDSSGKGSADKEEYA